MDSPRLRLILLFFGLRGLVWLALLVQLVFFVGQAGAQQAVPAEPTDDQVNAIAKQLYCPVCENIPLDVCPTQACEQWRALIREKLGQGWTEAQIKAYFAEQYGDRVLATPPARGQNWLLYLVPPAVILAGVWVLFQAFRSWRIPPASNEPPDSQEPVDEYVAWLEEELQKRQ
jgi:cytochrome c-type biogenesis protein CcmH